MILRVISIIAAIAVAVAPAGAQKKGKVLKTEAQNYINKISKESVLKGSHIGVLAVKVNGDTVAAINPFKRLMPASNNKLISTGLAINELGPDFRFQTKIAHSGFVRDGVLYGDLYIVGGGDPTIASEDSIAMPTNALLDTKAPTCLTVGSTRTWVPTTALVAEACPSTATARTLPLQQEPTPETPSA